LEFFKNQGIHVFAKESIEQLCEKRAPGNLQAVHDLLAKEFFFPTAGTPPSQAPQAPAWLSDVVLPVLESYWLSLYVIEQIPFDKWDDRKLSQKILELGETLKMRGSIEYYESLSRFPIQNAIARFVEMGILKNHVEDMGPSGKKLFSPGPNLEVRENTLHLLETLLGKPRSQPRAKTDLSAFPNVFPFLPKSEKV